MGDKLRIWLGDEQKVLGIRRNVQHAGQREMDLELPIMLDEDSKVLGSRKICRLIVGE